ncbi:hypothetical protein [Flavobacterium sp. N2820]|uniref:hypothetical protein n=1 Tax=Flavobacterium sp. N2820 TaxID=2986834 RepID=UPI00222546A3|nr:hypothetical protein [Flavobacterium sp. N2820]
MEKNTVIKLKTFKGTLKPTTKVKDRENYWKLIGEKGIVIDEADFNPEKVLVVFEKNIDDFDLENHNPIKNSLYIDKKDLELY